MPKVTTVIRKMPVFFSSLLLLIVTMAVFATPLSQVSQDWVAAYGGSEFWYSFREA
jgi:hypothetical protein